MRCHKSCPKWVSFDDFNPSRRADFNFSPVSSFSSRARAFSTDSPNFTPPSGNCQWNWYNLLKMLRRSIRNLPLFFTIATTFNLCNKRITFFFLPQNLYIFSIRPFQQGSPQTPLSFLLLRFGGMLCQLLSMPLSKFSWQTPWHSL